MTKRVIKLIKALEQLTNANYEEYKDALRHRANANDALLLIFRMGCEKIELSEEEKKKVSTLLPDAIIPLKLSIENHKYEFIKRLKSIILKKRSALQFLIDDYGCILIPSRDQKLSNIFDQQNLRKTVEINDEIIDEFRHDDEDSYHSNISDSFDSDISVQDYPGIPSPHYWWFRNR